MRAGHTRPALSWHWFSFGQTAKPAERVIGADPDAWYRTGPEPMGAEAYADYRRAIHDPATTWPRRPPRPWPPSCSSSSAERPAGQRPAQAPLWWPAMPMPQPSMGQIGHG